MDVFGRVPGADGELDLDLVAGGERRALGQRNQDPLVTAVLPAEVAAGDGKEVAAVLRWELLGREYQVAEAMRIPGLCFSTTVVAAVLGSISLPSKITRLALPV